MDPAVARQTGPTPVVFPFRESSFNRSLVQKAPISNVKGAFTLTNALTKEECFDFIRQSFSDEAMRGSVPVPFRGWSKNREKEKKELGRIITRPGEKPAEVLFERLREWLPQELKTVSEEDKGKERTWQIDRLSNRFRLVRYDPQMRSPPHYDEAEMYGKDCKSFFTLVFYLGKGGRLLSLNKDFRGGELVFLRRDNQQTFILRKIIPKRGLAIVFPHNTLHESRAILSGHKYIIRLDIVYKRKEINAEGHCLLG